jgi:hypothetical protein
VDLYLGSFRYPLFGCVFAVDALIPAIHTQQEPHAMSITYGLDKKTLETASGATKRLSIKDCMFDAFWQRSLAHMNL